MSEKSDSMRKYNIIAVRDYYPHKNNRASSVWVYNQVKALMEYGHTTLVVSPTPYIPFFLRRKPQYRFLPLPSNRIEDYLETDVVRPSYIKIPNYYMYSLTQKGLSRAILKSTRGCEPQLIHAHFGNNGIASMSLKTKFNVALITSFYGYDAGRLADKFKPFYANLISRGDLFLALSEDMKSDLLRIGFPEEKVKVFHLGVDIDRFRNGATMKRDKLTFLVVARFEEAKGIQDAIKAFSGVYKKYKDTELRIVGGGRYLNKLLELVNDLKLEGPIKILDNLGARDPRGMVLEEMRCCDVFLLTSFTTRSGHKEGTPIVLMEAQACSKPCISTYHAGIPEVVINGHTGFLVKERNIESIKEHMVRFIEEEDLRKKFGENARRHIEKEFNQKVQIGKLAKIYEEHINR
jgi:colanic acid/amylovoran biosynthesis glycosyltransferase